jgi:hypothetical protein
MVTIRHGIISSGSHRPEQSAFSLIGRDSRAQKAARRMRSRDVAIATVPTTSYEHTSTAWGTNGNWLSVRPLATLSSINPVSGDPHANCENSRVHNPR